MDGSIQGVDLLDSTPFGEVQVPESAEELIATVLWSDPVEERRRKWPRIWRGQGNIAWPVHSTAYRRLEQSPAVGRPIGDEEIAYYEQDLLKRATHNGFRVHAGRLLSDLELLALLRHHGAATRLVDATRSAMVAAWFAADDQADRIGALIGIHTHHLGGTPDEPHEGEYAEVMSDLEGREYPQTWQPSAVSPRVAAQHSQLLFSSVSPNRTGSLWLPHSDTDTWVLAVTPEVKRQLLHVLDRVFDIRYQTLFPDLGGFAYSESHRFPRFSHARW